MVTVASRSLARRFVSVHRGNQDSHTAQSCNQQNRRPHQRRINGLADIGDSQTRGAADFLHDLFGIRRDFDPLVRNGLSDFAGQGLPVNDSSTRNQGRPDQKINLSGCC